MVVLRPESAAIDFCILSQANHSIMSTGTFGLMSSLLAGGITLYQKIQVRPNSPIDRMFKVEDVIPNGWIPI